MRIMVSEDGYTVTGNKGLRRFSAGIASLDEDCKGNWVVLLDRNEQVTEILNKREQTKPRISILEDRIYIIPEGIDEDVHYYLDVDKFEKISTQINRDKVIVFGVLTPDRSGVEYLIESCAVLF